MNVILIQSKKCLPLKVTEEITCHLHLINTENENSLQDFANSELTESLPTYSKRFVINQ